MQKKTSQQTLLQQGGQDQGHLHQTQCTVENHRLLNHLEQTVRWLERE